MENASPLALTLIVIGAMMGFGREWLITGYLWVYKKIRGQEPPARLGAGVKLYLVMMSLIFTMVGLMGMFGIWQY